MVYEVIPGIVNFDSPSSVIYHFAFGERLGSLASDSAPVTVTYRVTGNKKLAAHQDGAWTRYHYFHGSHAHGSVSYERKVLPGVVFRLLLSGPDSERPILTVNRAYSRMPVRLNNIFPPGAHLTDLVTLALLRRGLAPLSAASFCRNGSAILLVAPPDTGKTMTVVGALMSGYADGYISEDITITDGAVAFGCPWTISFRHGSYIGSRWERKISSLSEISPVFALLSKRLAGNLPNVLGNVRVARQCKIGAVIFLVRRGLTRTESRKLSREEAFTLLRTINRYEFTYYRNPLLRACEYLGLLKSPLENLMHLEESILGTLLDGKEIYEINASDPKQFLDAIIDLVG